MPPEILQQGTIEAESSRTTGASNTAPPSETQQQHRHQLVHRDAAIVATENMTHKAHLKIEPKTGSSRNMKQHAIICESIHIDINNGYLTVYHTVRALRELRNQFIAPRNRKSPRSTKSFLRTFREIQQHDGVSSGIFTEQFGDKRPAEWTKQASKTFKDLQSRIWLR